MFFSLPGYYDLCWLLTVRCYCSDDLARETSPVMDVFFQSYTCLIYSKCSEQLSDFVLYCKLIHTREPWYQVSVRQARSLPKTSFRLHLAMNTLVVGWTLPAVRARWGLTPVRIRSCWANKKRGCVKIGTPSFYAQRSNFPKLGLCYFLEFL